MTNDIAPISTSFDWNNIDELESSLRDFEIVGWPRPKQCSAHCDVLRRLGNQLSATRTAVSNAVELAQGHSDLVILLLEPADSEATELHSENLPPTVEDVNHELQSVCRTRDWRNTCILDLRPFRSGVIRELEETPQEQDEYAHNATRTILETLRPDVLLVCQSSTRSSDNGFARSFSSPIGSYGKVLLHHQLGAKHMIVIHAFHPMYARHVPDGEQMVKRIRRAALRFAFIQAVNILNGRIIRGPGVTKLRDALYGASRTPHLLSQNGNLDRSLDDRFQGVYLSSKATPEFRRLWEEMMAEKEEEVSLVFPQRRYFVAHFKQEKTRADLFTHIVEDVQRRLIPLRD